VRDQQSLFNASEVLIEDKASGTQLIQELIAEGCDAVTRYQPSGDKTMRMHAQTPNAPAPRTMFPARRRGSDGCGGRQGRARGPRHSLHNYIAAYCQSYPGRLKSMILVPGGDVDWAVKEVKRLRNAPWVAAVWPLLPEGKPIDHPDLAPLWEEMNDADLLPQFFL
jgi:predicted TIM-barrel fold metal-dependent hydrolase